MHSSPHYRIRYCDLKGKDVPVSQARQFRVFLKGKHIRDFYPLSAALNWIDLQIKPLSIKP